MDKNQTKHRLTAADIITFLRIAGAIILLFLKMFSAEFFIIYVLTGLTDALDGWISRKTDSAGDFGAKLDSVADLLFYSVILVRIFPTLWERLPAGIWYAVAVIVTVRLSSYIVTWVKFRLFAALHTYLNKLTGIAVFLIPLLLNTDYGTVFCWAVSAISAAASLEELAIHLRSQDCRPNVKSIFCKQKTVDSLEFTACP